MHGCFWFVLNSIFVITKYLYEIPIRNTKILVHITNLFSGINTSGHVCGRHDLAICFVVRRLFLLLQYPGR